MNTKPDVSIIIPSYNSSDTIKKCIDAVLKSSKAAKREIFVIDDHSTDNTAKILNNYRHGKSLKILFHKKNMGASYTRNHGARIAKGKFLVYIDSDCVVDKNCINKLIEPFKSESIGMTQGLLIDPKNSVGESYGHFLTIFGFPYDLQPGDSIPQKNIYRIFGTKGLYAYRKTIFDLIGGQDEDYIFHGEDTDLSWRVSLSGYRTLFTKKAQGYHHHIKYEKRAISHFTYSEGCKNQISNIIKNAHPFVLPTMLLLNLLVWMGILLKFILLGRLGQAIGVCQGILWNVTHIAGTLRKRAAIKKYTSPTNDTLLIMFGPMNLHQFLFKGIRWLFYA